MGKGEVKHKLPKFHAVPGPMIRDNNHAPEACITTDAKQERFFGLEFPQCIGMFIFPHANNFANLVLGFTMQTRCFTCRQDAHRTSKEHKSNAPTPRRTKQPTTAVSKNGSSTHFSSNLRGRRNLLMAIILFSGKFSLECGNSSLYNRDPNFTSYVPQILKNYKK